MTSVVAPFEFAHLRTFDFLDVEAALLSQAEYRFKLFQIMAESIDVQSLLVDGQCVAFGGQIPNERAWVVLSKTGVKHPKLLIKTIRSILSRGTISVGTYVPNVPKYERFARVFGLAKTETYGLEECGYAFTWWEFRT